MTPVTTTRGGHPPAPPSSAVILIGHLTDEGESLSSRSAGFIQRGVERLGGPGVHLIKKLPSGDIKVWADPAAAQRLLAAVVMSVPSVASGGQTDLAIKFDKPKPRSAQGLIYAPFAAEEDVDELAQLLETQGVTAVRRLPSRGRHADGKLFVLTFSDSLVPDNILLLYHRLAVKPFVQYPMRCKRCQGYRHSARYCRRPVRCGTCAGAHLTDSCEAQAPRCAACDGDHPVTDSVCPEWRAQFLINKAMALDNISFQEAVRRFKLAPAPAQVATTRPPQQPSRFSQQPPTPPVWQQACPPPAPQQPRPPPAPQQQCPPPAPQQPRPPTAPQQSGAPRSPRQAAAPSTSHLERSPPSPWQRQNPVSYPVPRPWAATPRRRLELDRALSVHSHTDKAGNSIGGSHSPSSRDSVRRGNVGRGRHPPVPLSNRWGVLSECDSDASAQTQTGVTCRHTAEIGTQTEISDFSSRDCATQTDPQPTVLSDVGSQTEFLDSAPESGTETEFQSPETASQTVLSPADPGEGNTCVSHPTSTDTSESIPRDSATISRHLGSPAASSAALLSPMRTRATASRTASSK